MIAFFAAPSLGSWSVTISLAERPCPFIRFLKKCSAALLSLSSCTIQVVGREAPFRSAPGASLASVYFSYILNHCAQRYSLPLNGPVAYIAMGPLPTIFLISTGTPDESTPIQGGGVADWNHVPWQGRHPRPPDWPSLGLFQQGHYSGQAGRDITGDRAVEVRYQERFRLPSLSGSQ